MTWQRARRPEQIAERREEILTAAADLLGERDFDAISMSEIAERAGLGKGTLYHYYRTREEVFLQLYLRDARAWTGRLREALDDIGGETTPTAVAATVSYAEGGWPVFPLHGIRASGECAWGNPRCTSPGKHPGTPAGRNYTIVRRIIDLPGARRKKEARP